MTKIFRVNEKTIVNIVISIEADALVDIDDPDESIDALIALVRFKLANCLEELKVQLEEYKCSP